MSAGFVTFTYSYGWPAPVPSIVKQWPLTLPSMRTLVIICSLIALCWIETHKIWDSAAERLQWNIIFKCAIITEHTMMEDV